MYIYKITNKINGKVYIGQTRRSVDIRWYEHIQSFRKGDQTRLYSAFKSYGIENFEIVCIDKASTLEELNELEIKYIKEYNSIECGYNMCEGGSSNPMDSLECYENHNKKMRSAEVRAKISKSMKQSIKNRGGVSKEHAQHLSEALKRFYAEGNKPNYAVPQHLTESHKQALMQSHYKKVYCVDEEEKVVKKFDTVQLAAKWWYNSYRISFGPKKGQPVSDWHNLMDTIKKSATEDKYIQGLKWIYCV